MSVSFDYYKVFYYVARSGNITLAAKSLFLTQPTVSHCIRSLEEELGLTLFLRSKKGVALTPEGKILYEHVEQACRYIFKAEETLREYMLLQEGLVRIGASETTLRHYLIPYLEQFRRLCPGIRLKIANTTTFQALRDLKDGLIDLAVVLMTPGEGEDFQVTPLAPVQDILIGGSQFCHLHKRPLSVRELEQYPLISMEAGTTTRKFLDQFFLEHHSRLNPDIELAAADLITPMVSHNLGLGFVPYEFAKESLKAGTVFQLELEEQPPRRFICLVTHPEHPVSLAGEKFIRVLQDRTKRSAASGPGAMEQPSPTPG